MKKIYAISLAAAMLLTGCSTVAEDIPEDIETVEQVVTDDAAADIPEDHATEEAASDNVAADSEDEVIEAPGVTLVPGIWTCTMDGIPVGYCIINDDGLSGSTLPYDTGEGVDFDVEIGVNEITFHYGGEDNSTLYQIVGGDPSYIEMRESEDSELYVLQHFSDGTAADLEGVFFSDAQLVEMAEAYYEKLTGNEVTSAGWQTNEGNTVTITLNGGAAQYTVDRHNAEGFDDLTGEPIMIIPVE